MPDWWRALQPSVNASFVRLLLGKGEVAHRAAAVYADPLAVVLRVGDLDPGAAPEALVPCHLLPFVMEGIESFAVRASLEVGPSTLSRSAGTPEIH